MTKFPVRPVTFLVTVQSVQTMARRISNYFDITGSGFHLSILYEHVYQESTYSRDYIRQKKIT